MIIRKNGYAVHVQGQLLKNSDVTSHEQCFKVSPEYAPAKNLIVDVKAFAESGGSIQNIVGVMDTGGQMKVGWRDKNADVGNRCITLDYTYYIK